MSIKRMSEKELTDCRKYFWGNDADKDGQLNWVEFSNMCRETGLRITGAQMQKAFATADKNKNGFITFAEFASTYFVNDEHSNKFDVTEPLHQMSKDKISAIQTFFYDKTQQHYGKITRLTFIRMVKEYGILMNNQELNKAFTIADGDRDGKISYKEFTDNFMRNTIKTGDNITSAELLRIQKGFESVDDGDGKLTRKEFLDLLKSIGMELDMRSLNNVYRQADKDGDGTVTFEEFSEAYVAGKKGLSRRKTKNEKFSLSTLPTGKLAEIRRYFSLRDQDRNGRLNWSEFQKMLTDVGLKLPEAAMTKAFKTADQNKDGSISFAEFIQIYSNAEEFSDATVERNVERKKMSENEIVECCKYFWSADKDRDGRLSKTEFSNMLSVLGMQLSERELNKAFNTADLNKDGVISFNEFVKAYLNKNQKSKSLSVEEIKDIFHKYDKNKNGTLSNVEAGKALKGLGNQMDEKRLERLVQGIDRNQNGHITFYEFCHFLDIE